jgi:protein ImuB
LPEHVLETLRALGLCRIEQLLALPRASLPSRIGPEVLQRLDQALGIALELIVPVRPATPVTAAIALPDPAADRAALEFVLRSQIDQVVTFLADRCEGIQQLEVRLDCGQANAITILVGTVQPTVCRSHLTELVLTRLDQTALAGEVHAVRLTVRHSGPLDARQRQLFEQDDRAAQQRELVRLVDRLSNRLGKQQVVRPRLHPDVLPEHALRWQPLLDCEPPVSVTELPAGTVADRPLHLLQHPQGVDVVAVVPNGSLLRFVHQGRTYVIHHAWGPERLTAGWWRGGQIQRDYYRVETERGQRFWLFQRIKEEDWFLHGEFD